MSILLSAHQLSKAFGSKNLFKNLSFALSSGEKVALIGPNGAGKSTLLKILNGEEFLDAGEIHRQKGLKVARLAQVPQFKEGATIFSTLLEKTDPDDWEQMGEVQELISRLELQQFGDPEKVLIRDLSGGWKKRVALGRELVIRPDLLLLDEPTNHLDVASILWLEEFIAASPLAILTITHDRQFMQRVSQRILELDRRLPEGILSVSGDYSTYLEIKESQISAQQEREKKLKNTLRREVEWLRRGAKARQTKQQGRIQRAEELKEEVGALTQKNFVREVKMDFIGQEKNPKKLIELKGVSKIYGERILFKNLNLLITPKTRLGLLGTNGCGKSSLLRVLLGREEPSQGQVFHAENLQPIYFEQNRESLNPQDTVVKAVCPYGDYVDYGGQKVHVRGYLARFLFDPQQMEMPVAQLSGGEQSRLLLAQLMLKKGNVLVLDEPTNDLDFATLDILEECLQDFDGAVILVTHDRFFLQAVCNQILAFPPVEDLKNKELVMFADVLQWESWWEEEMQNLLSQQKIKEEKAPQKSKEPQKIISQSPLPLNQKKLSAKEQKEFLEIEQKIALAEKDLQDIVEQLGNDQVIKDTKKINDLTQKMSNQQINIEHLYLRWSDLEARAKIK